MQPKTELIYLKEHVHKETCSIIYLIQFAVDGQPCVPFWDTKQKRTLLGEDAWLEGLRENARGMLQELGPAPALSN